MKFLYLEVKYAWNGHYLGHYKIALLISTDHGYDHYGNACYRLKWLW